MKYAKDNNNKGFSLIEAIISLLILLIVILGLLYTLNLGINTNIQNELRDQAVLIAQGEINTLLNANPVITSDFTTTKNVSLNNFQETYTVNVNVTQQVNNSMANVYIYTVIVTWNYKGQTYMHQETVAVHS